MILITLPYPPSMNTYWRSLRAGPLAGRVLISERGRAYRIEVEAAARAHGVQCQRGPLKVTIGLHPPDKRRRDIDNPLKPLLDALTKAGAWEDDSQIRELHVVLADADRVSPRATVVVQEIGQAEVAKSGGV